MGIIELLDSAKSRANIPSDYALAKVLGIERQIVSAWRKGRKHPSNEEAVKLATLAGIEEMQVIAEIELITAKTEKKKDFWKSYLESRGIAATLALTGLGISLLLTPEPSQAVILQLQNYDAKSLEMHNNALKNNDIYIMRKIKPGRLALKASLHRSRFSPH